MKADLIIEIADQIDENSTLFDHSRDENNFVHPCTV